MNTYSILESVWKAKLSAAEKLVLAYLAYRANGEGVCWPGEESIASAVGMTRRGIQKVLRRLREAGIVSWERKGVNVYRINPARLAELERKHDPQETGCEPGSPECELRSPECEPGSHGAQMHDANYVRLNANLVRTNANVVRPNHTKNHTRTIHISPPYNPPPELEAGKGREGEDKVEPEEGAQKPSHPGIESSEQKLESSAAAREGAHENPFASFGDLAPLVEAMVRAAPGRAHQILERGRLLLTLHGPDTFKNLWEWARKNATYSPVGAFLRYADPSVPLPQELRGRLKGKEEAPASSPPPAPAREEAPEWLAPLARERGLEVACWWEGVARRLSLAERELPPGTVSPVRRWDQPRHEAVAAVLDRAMSAAWKWATGALAEALASDDPAKRLEALRAFVLGLVPPEAPWDWATLEARYVRRESPAPASRRPSEVNHAR